jgi:hypothetical protein
MAGEKSFSSQQPGLPEIRHSIDHKAEAEGLRGELARTKSYHEAQIKQEKCKSLTAVLTACGSFLGAVASFIYSVKKCN